MKKLICILLIIMSILITGCSSSEDKKLEKKPDKKLDLSEVILTYEGGIALIINGYGDVKRIDFSEDDKNPNIRYDDFYYQRVMKNPEIPILVNIGKIPEDIIDKIKRIPDVNVTRDDPPAKYFTSFISQYKCARGNGTKELTLLRKIGPGGCSPIDENAIAVYNYISQIIKKYDL